MSKADLRREECRLCRSRDMELVIKAVPTPPADAYVSKEQLDEVQKTYPLDIFFCKDCFLVQMLDIVPPEVIYPDYIYETSRSPGLLEHYQNYADDVLDSIDLPKGSFVVDIGCNDGTLLKFFKDKGMRVLGIDPAQEVVKKAAESGVEVMVEFFNAEVARRIKDKYGNAAVITSNNTIANIDDLTDIVEGVRGLLSPDGVFVIETGYLVDLVQNRVFDNIYHEHISYFSIMPLDSFFHSHGMELIDVKRVPTKGGSIRVTVQLAGGPRRTSSSVAETIALEKESGFDKPETFKDFAEQIESVKTDMLQLLKDKKAQGKTIAGYGASHSVTTLIYHFELSDLLDFLVDDNSLKQNLFSPGHHIPVLHPRAIYERRPDYVVILPWRFSKSIIKKHKQYLEQGGHFIVPLPKVEVI